MGTERKGGKPAAPGERHVALVQPELVSPSGAASVRAKA
ncbi:MAG: hypothetical protein QOJ61_1283 [Mycobacterium sp.]|jgi:hypothetical protein|nr:hypothetical protein [Mycobacterium sp.]